MNTGTNYSGPRTAVGLESSVAGGKNSATQGYIISTAASKYTSSPEFHLPIRLISR